MEKLYLNARDGYELDVHIFKAENAKAVIQLIHGMEEHQERYEKFINVLNENGYSVVSSNMRGHGENTKDLGFFKEKNGYIELVEDQKVISNYIKEHFPNLPIYIFAHSMGTIITRVLIQENSSNYKKVVLSGYPNFQIGAYLGIVIANIIKTFRGPKYKSKLIASLSVDSFNKYIKNPKTKCDWISHNEDNVKAYIEDPYCGIGFTCSAFNDLFYLVIKMHKAKLYKNINGEMKLLLLRGIDDPCTGGDIGANDSYAVLHDAGFEHIKTKEYPNMRHEILAEKDNEKVYEDVIMFFEEK